MSDELTLPNVIVNESTPDGDEIGANFTAMDTKIGGGLKRGNISPKSMFPFDINFTAHFFSVASQDGYFIDFVPNLFLILYGLRIHPRNIGDTMDIYMTVDDAVVATMTLPSDSEMVTEMFGYVSVNPGQNVRIYIDYDGGADTIQDAGLTILSYVRGAS